MCVEFKLRSVSSSLDYRICLRCWKRGAVDGTYLSVVSSNLCFLAQTRRKTECIRQRVIWVHPTIPVILLGDPFIYRAGWEGWKSRVPRSALGTPHAYYLTISLYPFSPELGYRQLFVFIYDGWRPTVYARLRTDLFIGMQSWIFCRKLY